VVIALLQTLADPRGKATVHAFLSIVVIAILAVVGGATDGKTLNFTVISSGMVRELFGLTQRGADVPYRRVFERLSRSPAAMFSVGSPKWLNRQGPGGFLLMANQ